MNPTKMTSTDYRECIKGIRERMPDTPARTLARMVFNESRNNDEHGIDLETAVFCWRLGHCSFASIYNRIRRFDGKI